MAVKEKWELGTHFSGEIISIEMKLLFIRRVDNKMTDVHFLRALLLNLSGKQAKFSSLFIASVHIILYDHFSINIFEKKHLLTLLEEFNFLQKLFLGEAFLTTPASKYLPLLIKSQAKNFNVKI